MIKSIRSKNFRSLRDTTIYLSKGINVILGISQAGKTNCTSRSLKLLKDNRPSSANFYSNFAPKKGSTEVELETYEGRTVSIKKNVEVKKDKETGKNKKKLLSTEYTHDKRQKPFTGIGRDVPDEIVDILNLSVINLQDQNDKPFLITETPGEVARVMNRITRLDRADEWIKDLTSRVNSTNKEVVRLAGDPDKNIIGEIKVAEIELLKYDNLEKIGNYIERVERLDGKIRSKEKEIDEIDIILDRLDILIDTVDVLEKALKAEDYLHKANEIEGSLNEYKIELNVLEEYESVCRDYLEIEQVGIELKADLETIKKYYDKVTGLKDKIDILENEEDILSDYCNAFKEKENVFREKEEYKDKLEILLKEMGKCPLCFGDIDSKCVNRILKEI